MNAMCEKRFVNLSINYETLGIFYKTTYFPYKISVRMFELRSLRRVPLSLSTIGAYVRVPSPLSGAQSRELSRTEHMLLVRPVMISNRKIFVNEHHFISQSDVTRKEEKHRDSLLFSSQE